MAADVEKTTAAAERRVFFAVLFAHGFARVLSKLASAPLERVKAKRRSVKLMILKVRFFPAPFQSLMFLHHPPKEGQTLNCESHFPFTG